MSKLASTRLAVAVGALALSLSAGAGVGSADPDLSAAVNTTCTYPQAVSALNKENPEVAAAFNSSLVAQSILRQFLASPPSGRAQLAQQIQVSPVGQQLVGVMEQIAATCNNY